MTMCGMRAYATYNKLLSSSALHLSHSVSQFDQINGIFQMKQLKCRTHTRTHNWPPFKRNIYSYNSLWIQFNWFYICFQYVDVSNYDLNTSIAHFIVHALLHVYVGSLKTINVRKLSAPSFGCTNDTITISSKMNGCLCHCNLYNLKCLKKLQKKSDFFLFFALMPKTLRIEI